MLLKSSQNNPLLQYIILLVLSLALWAGEFRSEGLGEWRVWLSWAVALTSAVAFGKVLVGHGLSRNDGLLAVLFLCVASVHGARAFSLSLCLYPLAVLTLHYILSVYGKDKSYPATFNMAFLWGLITILQPDLFFTLPCIFLILIAYSMNKWREWVCAASGVVFVYLLLFIFHFLLYGTLLWPVWNDWFCFGFPVWNSSLWLPVALLALMSLFSLGTVLSFRQYTQTLEISERRKSSALVVMFFYFFFFFAVTKVGLPARFFLFFPLAFLTCRFLCHGKINFWREAAFLLILGMSVLQAYL